MLAASTLRIQNRYSGLSMQPLRLKVNISHRIPQRAMKATADDPPLVPQGWGARGVVSSKRSIFRRSDGRSNQFHTITYRRLETCSAGGYSGTSSMLVGHARISTTDQSPAVHRDALAAAGCDRIFKETASGAKRERPLIGYRQYQHTAQSTTSPPKWRPLKSLIPRSSLHRQFTTSAPNIATEPPRLTCDPYHHGVDNPPMLHTVVKHPRC